MYDREDVELALEALGLGFSCSEAAALVGASRETVRQWAGGRVPHERGRLASDGRCGREAARMGKGGPYEPPASGPLSGLTPDQVENLLLRAVLADLKAGGWDPASISNRRKCELGERLRRETGLPLRCVTAFLRISKSSYEYHRARLGRDGDAWLRPLVREAFEAGRGAYGYRRVHAELRRRGTRVSEKVVRRVMREEGLVARRPPRRRWSSYAGEASPAPPNLPLRADGTHDFSAPAPNELWVTDITEFALPGEAGKCYLSCVLDCYDGKPVAWSAGPRPTAELANSSLEAACATLAPGERPVVHSDRGGHYRWPGWAEICGRFGLARSMSRKGSSPDNAAMEGFFGRLKVEFFFGRDWAGRDVPAFSAELSRYISWYGEGRLKAFREDGETVYDTIEGRRRRLGLAT